MKQARNLTQTKTQEVSEGELLKLGPNQICMKGAHYFKYRSGTEIECALCPVGYPIGPGTTIKDGTLYIHGEKLAI